PLRDALPIYNTSCRLKESAPAKGGRRTSIRQNLNAPLIAMAGFPNVTLVPLATFRTDKHLDRHFAQVRHLNPVTFGGAGFFQGVFKLNSPDQTLVDSEKVACAIALIEPVGSMTRTEINPGDRLPILTAERELCIADCLYR